MRRYRPQVVVDDCVGFEQSNGVDLLAMAGADMTQTGLALAMMMREWAIWLILLNNLLLMVSPPKLGSESMQTD